MKRRHTAILTAMAAAAALWSCEVIETPAPVPPEEGDEIVLEVQEQTFATKTKAEDGEETAVRILSDDDITMEMESAPFGADSVQTRATALTSLPSSLYWEGTTGAWKSETAKWASAPASISSGRLSTGKYQTGTATAYNYYVSNKAIIFAANGSTISASNGTDVIAGCTQGATSSTTPSVTLGHVFARTGAITLDTQAGFTLSGVSWKMESTSGSGGTAGTYNIATGEWSGMTALPQTAVSTGSDLYLVPGTYRLTVSYILTASGQSKAFTKTCNVSLTAGKVHNITATATGGTIDHELIVNPSSATLDVGERQTFRATYYTIVNGVRDSGTDVTSSASWSSSSTATATVSAGTVTGKAAGTATITATYSGLSASATVTVNGKTLEELFFSPSSIQMSVGDSQTAAVMARFSDGSTANVTSGCTATLPQSAWGSYFSVTRSDTFLTFKALAKVSSQSYVMSYTYEGKTLSATVNVSISDKVTYEYFISPSGTTITVGGSQAFVLYRQKYINGAATSDITALVSGTTWSIVSGSSHVTLSGNTVTGRAAGTATISATCTDNGQAITRTATVTVNAPAKLTVVSVTGTWKVGYPSYGSVVYINGINAAGGSVQTNTVTESGKTLVTINAMTNGHDETSFTMEETITYTLSDGTTHTYRTFNGRMGVMPGDDWSDTDGLWIRGDNIEPFLFYYRLVAD